VGNAPERRSIVLLSGPVGAGKTTLAEGLVAKLGFKRVATRDAILRRLPDTARTRVALQAAGERLDRETLGRWVADELHAVDAANEALPGIVVDAVLIKAQVEAIRATIQRPVIHVHLTATRLVLEMRYAKKQGAIEESETYSALLGSSTEANVDQLRELADLLFDTSNAEVDQEVAQIVRRLDQAMA
jgi:adenylosuccinate synthase